MSSYTPGPWHVTDRATGDSALVANVETGFDVAIACGGYVDYGGSVAVCAEWHPDVVAANAKLIAAAPELLEAATTMLSRFDSSSSYGFVTKADLQQLRAAIAKATDAGP